MVNIFILIFFFIFIRSFDYLNIWSKHITMNIEGYENYILFRNGDIINADTGRLLRQRNRNGYVAVTLFDKNRERKTHNVHRLLALHYIPNPFKKPYVDHINRDKKDNRLINLRWVSKSENNVNSILKKKNQLGVKNIYTRRKKAGFYVAIRRNTLTYSKYRSTLEEAIEQRNMMISMFLIQPPLY